MLGVVKLVPVPKLEPPVAAAYQLMVPAEAAAPNVTAPVPQLLPGVVPVIVGTGLTVTDVPELFACSHGVVAEVKTTVTTKGLVL